MIKRTFQAKGREYASELIVQNLQDLVKVLNWNNRNGINLYRLSSNMFPWMSEYEITELPGFDRIANLLSGIGQLAGKFQQRLSFHPGPFNVLASANPEVVDKTIKELDQHAQIMDLMGLEASPYNKINIHIGTTRSGHKEKAMAAFCEGFSRLSESTRARLTLENDDKEGMYLIQDLYQGVYTQVGLPLVFDFHHHFCHPGGYSQQESLELALSTWPEDIIPVVHYSEPRSFTDKRHLRAHSDYIAHQIPHYGHTLDVMLEAKQKECALLEYQKLDRAGKLEESLKPEV